MGFGSIWHWGIVLLVVLVLFGRSHISDIMGDFGSGIKSFKRGMTEDESAENERQIGKSNDGATARKNKDCQTKCTGW